MVILLKRPSRENKRQIIEMFDEILPQEIDRCGSRRLVDKFDNLGFEKWLEWLNDVEEDRDISASRATLFCSFDDNDDLVGFISVDNSDRRILPSYPFGVVNYYIRPQFRHCGLGTRQMELMLEEMREMGFTTFKIATQNDNVASRKIIEKLGGVFYGTEFGHPVFEISIPAP